MHHSKIPSLCNSKFDPHVQDSDSTHKFNIHCSKPIIAEMITFDQNSQILFDDDDTYTTFDHLDESTNQCFLFGGTRNSDVSLIPKVLNNIRDYTSVGNDHCVLPATDANGNDNDDDATDNDEAMNNDDDDGGGDGSGGGGGGGGRLEGGGNNALLIMKFNREGQLMDYRPTQMNPNNYESWQRIAAAVYNIWMDLYSLVGRVAGDTGPVETHPALCWPGYFPLFGRHEYGRFITLNWHTHDYHAVRDQINTLCVREMNYTELLALIEFAFGPDGNGGNDGNNNGNGGNGGNNNGDSGNGGNNNGDGGNNRS